MFDFIGFFVIWFDSPSFIVSNLATIIEFERFCFLRWNIFKFLYKVSWMLSLFDYYTFKMSCSSSLIHHNHFQATRCLMHKIFSFKTFCNHDFTIVFTNQRS